MKNKLYRRAIEIGIVLLLIGASGIATVNAETRNKNPTAPFDIIWEDDFDDYEEGQFLDGGPEDGGWKGWDNDPQFGAYVSANQASSDPHSVEIAWFTDVAADLVHEFSGVNSGTYTFTAWQFIPSDFSGETNFLLMNTYEDGEPHENPHWSNALTFSSITGNVESFEGNWLPIIFDQWIEIRIEIDFTEDSQGIYYSDELLISKSWTAGIAPGGALNLACVDLYAGDISSTSVYYDDLSLEGEAAPPEPELEIESIEGGFGITAVIKNIGDADATDVDWSITLDGGLIILGKETSDTIPSIAPGEQATIESDLILGIGKTTIKVSATCAEGKSADDTASGFVLLFFVLQVE